MRHPTTAEGITVGILGGMGPRATTEFMNKLMDATPANTDQDHLSTVVVNDPHVPDRSDAILRGGESPVPRLQNNARRIEAAGADLLVCPCNTFHYFFDEVSDVVTIEFLHMIERTVEVVHAEPVDTVGILGTEGTIEGRVYHEYLDEGLELVAPTDLDAVMRCIYQIKQGKRDEPREGLHRIYGELRENGADLVIAACTEIPVVLEGLPHMLDPMDVMAEACVRRAMQKA